MTFPTIPTVAAGRVLTTNQADTSGTRTFPDLSSLTKNSGDLLLAIIITYQSTTNPQFSSWGGGFTEFSDQGSSTTMGVGIAYKISTGSETGTFTVTQADTITGHASMILLSIPGANAITAPEAGTKADGTSAAADPGSFNPSGWDAEDTLWIAVGGSGETGTGGAYTGIASAPTNYSDYVDTGISADAVGGVEGAVAFRQLNAASEDVGTFSVDVSNARNSAVVIAVRPLIHSVLDAAPGSYSVTGAAATILSARFINAAAGSYAVSGADATLTFTTLSALMEGAWWPEAIEPDPLAIVEWITSPGAAPASFVLNAEPGAYTITGAAATFLVGYFLNAVPGAYAVTGALAILAAGRLFDAAAGAYNIAGADATLTKGFSLNAEAGAYVVTGQAAELLAARMLDAGAGVYLVTGAAAELVFTPSGAFQLNAEPGVYLISGANAELVYVPIGGVPTAIYIPVWRPRRR